MRKWLWFLFIPALFSLIACLVVVSLAEYAKTGRCYRNGSILRPEELRSQTIRSLLTAVMESSKRENKYKAYVQNFLIQRSLTSSDVKDAVLSKSIVNLPNDATYSLNSDKDIGSVAPVFLQGDFSIVQYGAGNVRIIPSRSIEAVDAKAARKDLDDVRKHRFDLSLLERALGYGNYYFQVQGFLFIDLACCEDRYSKYPKDGKAPEWYARRIVDSIVAGEQPIRRHLVVSNCGDILHRSEDGYIWYSF